MGMDEGRRLTVLGRYLGSIQCQLSAFQPAGPQAVRAGLI